LGPDVDALVNRSPLLKRQVEALQVNNWRIRYSTPSDGPGSTCNKRRQVIVIDSRLQSHPTYATQTLAHEAGHAGYPEAPYVSPHGKTKAEYVGQNTQRHLDDEGAATLNNARARQEILDDGGADIGIAGQQQPHYEAINRDCEAGKLSEEQARRQIGDVFADHERTSNTGQTYRDYYSKLYSDFWDQQYPNVPTGGTAP
jgi:type VI secretion system secreted protein VgrG